MQSLQNTFQAFLINKTRKEKTNGGTWFEGTLKQQKNNNFPNEMNGTTMNVFDR